MEQILLSTFEWEWGPIEEKLKDEEKEVNIKEENESEWKNNWIISTIEEKKIDNLYSKLNL